MGGREAVETELRKLIDGPPKATAKDFAVCLGRLALHYWRPDFTAEQAKLLYQDFISDLAGVTAEELNEACGEWRRDPLNRFFPTTGQLRELVTDRLRDRARVKSGAEFMLNVVRNPKRGDEPVKDVAARLHALGQKMKAK